MQAQLADIRPRLRAPPASHRHGDSAQTNFPKPLIACTQPLTGVACVTRIYTSRTLRDANGTHLVLRQKRCGLTIAQLQAQTGAPLHLDGRSKT